MTELVIVKLGGSLITDKRRDAHPRTRVIRRLAREIAGAGGHLGEKLLLSHGSGSFGHATAARHGIGSGPLGPDSGYGASATRHQAARLHDLVTGELLAAGLAPFTWAPSSAVVARAGRPVSGAIEPLLAALDFGLLPVVYGEVVTDREWGASIVSTEAVLRYLSGRLRRRGLAVRRVLWLGATAGILDGEGETVPRIDLSSYARVRRMIGATAGTDVTGGMLLRLETTRWLARRGVESWIVDGRSPGLLAAALEGRDVPGTRFAAET